MLYVDQRVFCYLCFYCQIIFFFNLSIVYKSMPTSYLIGWLTNTPAYYTIIFINVLCSSTKSIISVGKTPVVVCWLENALVFVFFAESTFLNIIIVSKSVKIVSFFDVLSETSALAYYTVVFINAPWWSTKSIIYVGKTPVVVFWLENVSVFVFLLMNQLFSI